MNKTIDGNYNILDHIESFLPTLKYDQNFCRSIGSSKSGSAVIDLSSSTFYSDISSTFSISGNAETYDYSNPIVCDKLQTASIATDGSGFFQTDSIECSIELDFSNGEFNIEVDYKDDLLNAVKRCVDRIDSLLSDSQEEPDLCYKPLINLIGVDENFVSVSPSITADPYRYYHEEDQETLERISSYIEDAVDYLSSINWFTNYVCDIADAEIETYYAVENKIQNISFSVPLIAKKDTIEISENERLQYTDDNVLGCFVVRFEREEASEDLENTDFYFSTYYNLIWLFYSKNTKKVVLPSSVEDEATTIGDIDAFYNSKTTLKNSTIYAENLLNRFKIVMDEQSSYDLLDLIKTTLYR